MRNQLDAASRLGIQAETINSSNRGEWETVQQRVLQDNVDALLISPERLANEDFVATVLRPLAEHIGLLVVDEAHCISDWGHDFRPDYRRIGNVLRAMPDNVPILGMTATANTRVILDVQEQLGNIEIQRGPLIRKSIALETMRLPTKAARLAWLAEHVPSLCQMGTGVIYTLTKIDADQVAAWLTERGVKARAYYSDVIADGYDDPNVYRQELERQLLDNELDALVATTALGMGYDKPDLRYVVHYQAPGSIVAYYQQVGRAGRSIDHAAGILMTGKEDGDIQAFFRRNAFPPEERVNKILDILAESDGLSVSELEQKVNLHRGQIEQALKVLAVEDPAPLINEERKWRRTPVAYSMDRERIQWLTQQREKEWREIQAYIDEQGCLMKFLAQALDDTNVESCGKCSSCLGGPVTGREFPPELVHSAARFIRQSEMPLKCKVQIPKDSFSEYGFSGRLSPVLRAETGRILSRYRDAGWGTKVANGKYAGRFGDELVDATVEMIGRWAPSPAPEWITCVPSVKRPTLLPDFASRLAVALGVPFLSVVTKVKDKEPQKEQQNAFHQCRNLDGVFRIDDECPSGPVLLLDDIYDSGWTMTVVAALLRQKEIGSVLPVALTAAS